MTSTNALILRLLGPLIEIVCVIILLKIRGQGRSIAGIPVEYPLYAGLAVGFTLVLVGLAFTRISPRPPRDSS
jgi:hypothetical protein